MIYKKSLVRTVAAAVLALGALGVAKADWLATDPGTPISLQVNTNGTIVIRPIGGAWAHPLCSDVTTAVIVRQFSFTERMENLLEVLTAAATHGSLVNVYALPDRCHVNGFPIVTAVRVQTP